MNNNNIAKNQAQEDFNKARSKEKFERIFNIINPEKQELLSFYDVKSLLQPRGETYKGMQVIPIDKIIGSEGRYKDFNKTFLPRKEFLRGRWESIDRAHLTDVILPPIKLYQVGNVYFVRDGNHRVSVAKMQGVEAIDAEVVELSTEIPIDPDMNKKDLLEKLVEYEKERFINETKLNSVIDMNDLIFTAPGRYYEVLNHILGHKYYVNQYKEEEITLEEAALSWYTYLFLPILNVIDEEELLSRFPGRTRADLYMWIIKHWDELKKKDGGHITLKTAAQDYSSKYGQSWWDQFKAWFLRVFFPGQYEKFKKKKPASPEEKEQQEKESQ